MVPPCSKLLIGLSLLITQLALPSAIHAQDNQHDPYKNDFNFEHFKEIEDPSARYQAGKRHFDNLARPLNAAVQKRIKEPQKEQEQQQNPNLLESTELRRRDIQEEQDRQAQARLEAQRAAEAARAAQIAEQELAEASASALRLIQLHNQWSEFLDSEGYRSEAAEHKTKAEEFTRKASRLLCEEGVLFYRSGRLDEAVAKFRASESTAPSLSREQMTAADNLLFPLEKIGNADEIWQAKRNSHVLHFKIDKVPIPEDYDGETPDLALENKLIKHDDKENLLRFYQARHQYEKARNVFAQILDGMQWSDSNKVQRHREWANYCESEGQMADAANHRRIADLLEKKQIAWRKQEEIRQRKIAEEQRRLAEKQAREEERERKRQAALQAEEEKRRLAMSEEEKRQQEEARRAAEERLKQPPNLVGKTFRSDYGGALHFLDSSKVDINTAFQQAVRTGIYSTSNFGDVPDIMPGTYTIVGSAPEWTIRIESTLKGSPRVDNYSFVVDKDGSIKLIGGAGPLPTLLRGEKAFLSDTSPR